jgi:hypothetical protein
MPGSTSGVASSIALSREASILQGKTWPVSIRSVSIGSA